MKRALVLIVIADVDVGTIADFAGIAGNLAGDELDQRGFAHAVGADEGDAVAGAYMQREAREKMLFAEGFADLMDHQHVLAGAPARLKPESDGAFVHRLFQLLHALQRLFPAFRRADGLLTVEHPVARDDRLLALDLLLLELVGADARFKALLALGDVAGVVAVVLLGGAHQDLHHAGTDMVEKVTVVRDDQHAAAVGGQIVFKPGERLHVQVVGRLIQQQQIGLLQQQPRQAQTRLLTAGEGIDVLIILAGLEAQAVEHAGNHALPGVAVRVFKPARQLVVVGREAAELRGIGVRVLHLVFQLAQPLFHLKDRLVYLFKLRPDAGAAGDHVLLGEIADARAAHDGDFAAVGRIKACDDAHQGRFAAAVHANKPDAVALLEGEGDILQHDVDAKGLGDILCAQNDHVVIAPIDIKRKAMQNLSIYYTI